MEIEQILFEKSHGDKKIFDSMMKIMFLEGIFECISKTRFRDKLIVRNDLLYKKINNNEIDNTIYIALKDKNLYSFTILRMFREIFYYSKDIKYNILNIDRIDNKVILNVECIYKKDKYIIPIIVNNIIDEYPTGRILRYKSIIKDTQVKLLVFSPDELVSEVFYNIVTSNVDIKMCFNLYFLYRRYKIDNNKVLSNISKVFKRNDKIMDLKAIHIMIESIRNSRNLRVKWNNYQQNRCLSRMIEYDDFIVVLKTIEDIF